MKIEIGDLLDIKVGTILHQSNTKGTLDKGLGKLLCNKYPGLHTHVNKYLDEMIFDGNGLSSDQLFFGKYTVYQATPSLKIVTCFTELGICSDRKKGERENTRYDAIIDVFDAVYRNVIMAHNIQVDLEPTHGYVPFLYGCGLAGGNWNIVQEILKRYPFTVIARHEDYIKHHSNYCGAK